MAVASALSTIALVSALAAPGLAAAAPGPVEVATEPTEETAKMPAGETVTATLAGVVEEDAAAVAGADGGDGEPQICVRISTSPPAVGVHEDCGSGSGVQIDDRSIP